MMEDDESRKISRQRKQRRAITHDDLNVLWDELVGTSGHTKAHIEFSIDESLIARINSLTGWSIDADYVFALNGEDVRHIYNEHHFETRKGQISIEKYDFLCLPEILNAPDEMVVDVDVRYEKVLIMRKYFDRVVFVVAFHAAARKSLQIKSMRKQ